MVIIISDEQNISSILLAIYLVDLYSLVRQYARYYNGTMADRFSTALKLLYSLSLLVLPVVAVVVIIQDAQRLQVSEAEVNFLLSSFFLVALLNLFFLVLYQAYLPDNVVTLCTLLFSPIIAAVGHTTITGNGFWFVLAETGMIYTIEIILAFASIIALILLVATTNSIREKDFSTFTGALLTCGIQLLFLIPGGGAVYIFSKIMINNIFAETAAQYGVWLVIAIVNYVLFIIPIVENIWAFMRHLKSESILD